MSIVFHFITFTVKWKIRYRNRLAKQHYRRDLSVSLNRHRNNSWVQTHQFLMLGRLCAQEPRSQNCSAPTVPNTAHRIDQRAPSLTVTLAGLHTIQLKFLHKYTETFFLAAEGQFCKLPFCWLLEC